MGSCFQDVKKKKKQKQQKQQQQQQQQGSSWSPQERESSMVVAFLSRDCQAVLMTFAQRQCKRFGLKSLLSVLRRRVKAQGDKASRPEKICLMGSMAKRGVALSILGLGTSVVLLRMICGEFLLSQC